MNDNNNEQTVNNEQPAYANNVLAGIEMTDEQTLKYRTIQHNLVEAKRMTESLIATANTVIEQAESGENNSGLSLSDMNSSRKIVIWLDEFIDLCIANRVVPIDIFENDES